MIYTVKIEEHYAWTVQVEAASQEEAEKIVRDGYASGDEYQSGELLYGKTEVNVVVEDEVATA